MLLYITTRAFLDRSVWYSSNTIKLNICTFFPNKTMYIYLAPMKSKADMYDIKFKDYRIYIFTTFIWWR